MTPSGDFEPRRWVLSGKVHLTFIVILLVPLGARGQDTWGQGAAPVLNLPSSKQMGTVPGNPQRVNSLPMSIAVSPDRRYVETGKVTDFPDARTGLSSKETLYSGLAFSPSGRYLYASMASLTNPTGDAKGNPGSGIVEYGFDAGKITAGRLIPISLQKLPAGRKTELRE